ncbi:MAG: protein translocase subunit SecF [Clostridium sp.]|nr:protein translocase subunit SecF [Clostridium sp.]MCM1546759.1 protein translocase subunit SecF [Ruminococcus sp.]
MNNNVYDFSSKKKTWFLIPLVLMVIIAVFTVIRGVEVAIEFKGGTIISYASEKDCDVNSVQKDIESLLETPVTIQKGESLSGNSDTFSISFSYDQGLSAEKQNSLTKLLQEKFPDNGIEQLDSNDVNPTSGREFFIKCIIVSIIAAILIILYIAIRFKQISGWSAGVCAVIGLIHNLVFVFGTFVIMGYEINANFIAVILTILGYSVNDTIVVYDRIRENKSIMKKASISELVNVSTAQSLRRSIRTSITTISTMIIVTIVAYIFGVSSILSFSIPMIIGMIAGTYSSLFIASQLWVWWNERRKPKSKKK